MRFNINIIEEIIKNVKSARFDTSRFLTKCYQIDDESVFNAPLLAEKNLNIFVGYIQELINNDYKNNIYSLFKNVSARILEPNYNYFIVRDILKDLNAITDLKFEEFCGKLFVNCFNAYDMQITPPKGDGGIDFIGKIPVVANNSNFRFSYSKVFGQSKRYTGNISRPEIDKFIGCADRIKDEDKYPSKFFVFCTTSDFVHTSLDELKRKHFIGLNGMQLSTLVFNYLKAINYTGSDYIVEFLKINMR